MMASIIGCVLSALQQLTGINAVMFYSNKIFAGLSGSSFTPTMGTALVGIVNMVATLGSSVLLVCNHISY